MNTGYFYLRLLPTAATPTIYSNSFPITYADNVDLGNQQTAQQQAFFDSQGDPANYNTACSGEYPDMGSANDAKTAEMKKVPGALQANWPAAVVSAK